jgi:hypothetical protein
MTKKEYLENIFNAAINDSKVDKIESVYGKNLPSLLKKIISNCEEVVFFDDNVRVLSYMEIIDAESDLHVQFSAKGLIPIVDCGENDFIVYHINDKIWSKFNIVDETVFKKKENLEDLLK